MKRSATLYKAKMRKKDPQADTSKEHSGHEASDDYIAFPPVSSEDLSDDVPSDSVSEIFYFDQ